MMNRLRDLKTKQDELRECLTSVITDRKSRLACVSPINVVDQPASPESLTDSILVSEFPRACPH